MEESGKKFEIKNMTVEQAETEISLYVISPDDWNDWFRECIEAPTAKAIVCEDVADAIRKINLGYHALKEPANGEFKGRIRLARRGHIVYILPKEAEDSLRETI